ncbi:calnexin-like isoform X2 [Scyliorhinus canicula]|uniref:calnexin-like isoform X2 n=1 Tax=Scyliorhinus canicula TaxID=7830 RepID=UPI0018F739F1|nr:calnexin-like isoform X2 [Scyliorhinus canicula]XP_038630966.1 calnexin-like isoform X2 [Scyliorhinus canicula]
MQVMQLQIISYLGVCGLTLLFAQGIADDSHFQDAESSHPNRVDYKPPKPVGDVYFVATFDTDDLEGWVKSKARKDDTNDTRYDGIWAVEESYQEKMPGNKGLVLKSHAKHHAIAAYFKKPFHFKNLPLIVQYEVHFQNEIKCGGAYLKLLSVDDQLDLEQFFDKTAYTIMFGPDKCGQDYKLHFIFRHRDPVTGAYEEKHAKKTDVDLQSYFIDKRPHLYTLIVRPDSSFEMLIDENSVSKGNLLQDMSPPVNPPKEIDDPSHQKPEDWDDRLQIPDPESVKPHDWDEDAPRFIQDSTVMKPDNWLDEEPEYVPDPESKKPPDWDIDMDGEWQEPEIPNPLCKTAGCGTWKPPMIPNPVYKGKWKVPMIDNPKYKGVWKPRKIVNPDYFEDTKPFLMTPIAAVGLELWSLTPDILFDNFIVSSDENVVKQWVKDTWAQTKAIYDADGPGLILQLFLAADKRPWLWGVYVFTVALPVILFISFYWPNKRFGPPDDYYYKKTDDVQISDEEKLITEAEPQESDQQDNEVKSKEMTEGGALGKMTAYLETSAQAQGGGEPDPGQITAEALRYRKTNPK